jgi:hypothetical protein
VLLFLFRGNPPSDCPDAMDANDDGKLDIGDPIFLLSFLFRGARPMPAPYPGAGTDPTPDGIPDC